ncbi:MAG: hypothetical protein AAF668_04130 [Pseudomonadota bacterium]
MTALLISIGAIFVGFVAFATWKAPRLTSILFWSLMATIPTASLIVFLAPGSFLNRVGWLAVSLPAIWVAFQFLSYWLPRPRLTALGFILISATGFAFIAATGPAI